MLKDYFRNSVEFYTVERLINSGRQPLGRVLNPILAVFLKKNETLQLYAAFWEDMRRREALPPFRWGAELADLRPAVVLGPFWWLHNPFGKMIVRSSLPYPWVILMRIVYPTHMLKARYDLTRLACLWNERIASGRTAGLEQELQSFPQKDPFSGAPFRCNSQKSLLYSIGPDGADNGGNEQFIFYRDSDIAVPCRPSAAPAPTSSALRK